MTDLFDPLDTAVISDDGMYRYRLDRFVSRQGRLVFAFFGVNGSTAGKQTNDQTVKKWIGFTLRNDGRRFIAANPFAYRARDVGDLATAVDPIGPHNSRYLDAIIREADVLVPCWGRRDKLPPRLRPELDGLMMRIRASGKPRAYFGFTQGGDPVHPQMLGYDTPLIWAPKHSVLWNGND